MTTPTPVGPDATSAPWRVVAPDIFELVDAIERRASASVDPAILGPLRVAIASILGADGMPTDRTGAASAPATAVASCVAFAEQFVVDVAGTTDEQRAALTAAMGSDTFTFVQVLYVSDVLLRLRIGLARLFDSPVPRSAGVAGEVDERGGDDLWTLLERFMRQVARLDAVDPLTAELVRLRGAQVHDCRLCRSRRSIRAIDAAGDARMLEAGPEADAARPERQRVALALTDALVTQPSSIDAALVARVQAQFSRDEIVEIALDVARNAANKIAVSLGADAAQVTDGVEFYDIDATGEVVADADIDTVRTATAR